MVQANMKRISRSAVVVTGICLVALVTGIVLGYYGSDNRPAAGFNCVVEDVCGTGRRLTVTPEVTAYAPGPQLVLNEVVATAPAPRLVMATVEVVADRATNSTTIN